MAKHYKFNKQLEDVVKNPYLDDFYNQEFIFASPVYILTFDKTKSRVITINIVLAFVAWWISNSKHCRS